MAQKIPQLFLLLSLLTLVLTFGYWLWRDGEYTISMDRSSHTVALTQALQYQSEKQTPEHLQRMSDLGLRNKPDLVFILISDHKHTPLVSRSRLEGEEEKWVRTTLHSPTGAAQLAKHHLSLHTHELNLAQNTPAFLHVVYDDTLLREHRERVIIITFLASGVIFLLWTITIILCPLGRQPADDEPAEEGHTEPPADDKPAEEGHTEPSADDKPAEEEHTEPRIDELTSLYSRNAFDGLIKEKCLDSARALPLVLIIAGLDHFKEVNESFGRHVGDIVIKKSAALLKAGLPKHAACCRFDGEKFGILIPKCTLAEAMGIADDLRMRLAAAKLLHNRALTASFGVSVALQAGKAQAEQLTQRAMDALQFSKSHGRNMVSSNIAE